MMFLGTTQSQNESRSVYVYVMCTNVLSPDQEVMLVQLNYHCNCI